MKFKMDKLNKRFVSTCEVVFQPKYADQDSTHYFDNVVRPQLEMEAVERWERELSGRQ